MGLLCVILFVTPTSVFAAKIDSISGKSVTVFLQTLDDEDVQVGSLIYLTTKSGKRKVTLKVTNNRGVMADTKVVSGTPKKSYSVLMPHQIKKAAPVKNVAKPKPKKRIVTKKTVPAPATPSLPPVKKVRTQPRRPRKTAIQKRPEPPPAEVKSEPAENIAFESDIDNDDIEDEDSDGDDFESSSAPAGGAFRWNISMDVLSLAGLFYDYQVFSFMAERRIFHGFSIGLSFNFGTFESNEGLNVTDKPLVRRTEYGVFGRYNFSGDSYESGIYTSLAFKAASENWVETQNYSEATDGGSVGVLTVGYQYILKTLTLRAGYALQYSSLPEEAQFESVTHIRTQALMTGMAHYAVIQFGILF